MNRALPTTPFGRRSVPLDLIATQIETRAFADKAASREPVHKWRLFRSLSETCRLYGLSDRALTVLHALLGFHPETALTLSPEAPAIVVFPSSRELETRSNGMSASTVRRHLAALVAAGMIVRRDSPNGKRYARRTAAGEIGEAFGFDLAPLVARAAAIEAGAVAQREEARACALLRERVSILRRDAAALIATGVETAPEDGWEAIAARLAPLVAVRARKALRGDLERLAADLEALAREAESRLKLPESEQGDDEAQSEAGPEANSDHAALSRGKTGGESEEMGGNDSHSARHIQNQNQTPDFEPASKKAAASVPGQQPEMDRPASHIGKGFPMSTLLAAFPDMKLYARQDIRTQADFLAAANLARSALGVSPDAWSSAIAAMGRTEAAVAVAAILQRADKISSPGGYLRALTAKARQGGFAVGPLLIAQLKARAPARLAPERTG